MDKIGLIGAMSKEIAPLLAALEEAREERVGTFTFHIGMLCGVPVVVGCCGVGKVNAAMGAQTMLLHYAPKLVLHMGVCGSLTKQLKIGDVAVAKDCVQYDIDVSALGEPLGLVSGVERVDFPCDSRAVRQIYAASAEHRAAGFNVAIGRVSTGDRFLTKAEDKEFIVAIFGALTCDQESCAVAQACFMNETPFAVIRAVSDASDGAHGEEFRQNVGRVSDIAAGLSLKFLEKFGLNWI